jgi:hypothetical protein
MYHHDLGPEGGDRGAEIVAQGTPEQVARAEGQCHLVFGRASKSFIFSATPVAAYKLLRAGPALVRHLAGSVAGRRNENQT